ncbi:response regulator transcription factor [Pedobacter sp.]|uniref:response regulator transcription factor n=1 Tax=Pedobacter sp. TaxID=1411316 RepID=UPI003D7FBF7E
MNLVDHNQRIPAGIVDGSVEFFIFQAEIMCMYNGKRYSFDDFPSEVIAIVNAEMEKDPIAIACLIAWGMVDLATQMRQFIACKWGGYDSNPDISPDGKIQPAEYIECGRRGMCPYEGKLCSSIKLQHGILTKSEVAVLKCLGECLLDKEIADKLNISEHTLRHHKDSICRKSGLERKPALVGLAYKLGLVTF